MSSSSSRQQDIFKTSRQRTEKFFSISSGSINTHNNQNPHSSYNQPTFNNQNQNFQLQQPLVQTQQTGDQSKSNQDQQSKVQKTVKKRNANKIDGRLYLPLDVYESIIKREAKQARRKERAKRVQEAKKKKRLEKRKKRLLQQLNNQSMENMLLGTEVVGGDLHLLEPQIKDDGGDSLDDESISDIEVTISVQSEDEKQEKKQQEFKTFEGNGQNEEEILREVDQEMRMIFESFPDSLQEHCLAIINSVSMNKYNQVLSEVENLDPQEVEQNLKKLGILAQKLDRQTLIGMASIEHFGRHKLKKGINYR